MPTIADLISQYASLAGQIILTIVVFCLLEKWQPAEKTQPGKALLFNLLYILCYVALVVILSFPANNLLVAARNFLGGGLISIPTDQKSGLLGQICLGLGYAIVYDYFQYWGHRMQHEVPFLWVVHKLHHTDTSLNASTATRVHILSHIFGVMCINLPILILFKDFTPAAITSFLVFNLWGFFIHMNSKLSLGPLTSVVTGPQFHRIHHSTVPEHVNKNYAGFFPCLDYIFGTYHQPKADEFPATGVVGEEDIHDLWLVNIAPIKDWWQMLEKNIRKIFSLPERVFDNQANL